MGRLVRTTSLAVAALGTVLLAAIPAGATHAGEKITVSKTSGLKDGDVVQVSFSGFVPGGVDGQHPNAKIVVAGQNSFNGIPDKLNFTEYAGAPEVLVQPDGTGAASYTVYADHGTVQDGTTLNCNVNKCWLIVIQEPFLGPEGQPRYAAQEITFGSTAPATSAAPATTAAPTTVVAAETTTSAAPAAESTTTTVAETTTTSAPADDAAEGSTASVDDEGGSNTGVIIGGVIAALVVIGGGAFMATRKKPPVDGAQPGESPGGDAPSAG